LDAGLIGELVVETPGADVEQLSRGDDVAAAPAGITGLEEVREELGDPPRRLGFAVRPGGLAGRAPGSHPEAGGEHGQRGEG